MVAQVAIPDKVTTWSHVVRDGYYEPVQDLIWLCEADDQKEDAIPEDIVGLKKQLDYKKQAHMVKQVECNR